MKQEPIKTHHFVFDKFANGGETLTLTTHFFVNPDGSIRWNQELTLNSYGNSASFNLNSTLIDPKTLKKLAQELEEVQKEVETIGLCI